MSDLFDTPLVSGLRYAEEVISAAEERKLLDRLMPLDLAPFRFHGWLGNRRTQSFGWRYDFDDASFTPAEPIPGWLEPLRSRAASFAGLQPNDFVHVLIARYDPGAGIGWHRDRPQYGEVLGLSLGIDCTMRLRRRTDSGFERCNVALPSRSLYRLSGEVRWEWEHSIAPLAETRRSITFRTLR